MSTNTKPLISLMIATTAAFSALIAWGFVAEADTDNFRQLIRNPWGMVSLADLYIGFVFVSIWIYFVEERRWLVPVLIVLLMVSGNLLTLVYAIIRLIKFGSLRGALFGENTSPART